MMRFLRIKSTCVCVISAGRRDGGKGGEKERETERMAERRREKEGEGKAEGEGASETILKGYCPVSVPGKMLEHQESIKEIIWENFYIQPEVERRCIFHIRECRKIATLD